MSQGLPKIILIDDESDNLKALERTLRSRFDVTTSTDPKKALQQIENGDFAVVVTDQKMPEMSGTDLLAKVAKSCPLVTRVMLTAHTETKGMLDAINRAEIYRYITKPWDNDELISTLLNAVEYNELRSKNEELLRTLETKNKSLDEINRTLENTIQRRTAELRNANEKLEELAMTDPLTGVLNRRAFFNKFNEEVDRSTRYKHAIAVAMIDVDHFKPFNDMEGHVFGDEALRKVAQIFVKNLRKTDALCRYGGEEFCIMMPETDVDTANVICERLRTVVEETEFQGKSGSAYLTISVGLSGFPKDGEESKELVESADQALYVAKRSGRNRVVRYGAEEPIFASE